MGKKKRGKKKEVLKNIKDPNEKTISENTNDIREPCKNTIIFNDKYVNIHETLNENIGFNLNNIENIFKSISDELNSTFSHPWSNWINN